MGKVLHFQLKCMVMGKGEGREHQEEKDDKFFLALSPLRSVSCPFFKNAVNSIADYVNVNLEL